MSELFGREAEFEAAQEALDEVNLLAQVQHGRAQGMGMAAFALGMWQGLDDSGLTREEKLALIQAALTG